MYFVIPNPEKMRKNNIIIVDIKKFTVALVTTEIGNISLGKYTFCIILLLFINYFMLCCYANIFNHSFIEHFLLRI